VSFKDGTAVKIRLQITNTMQDDAYLEEMKRNGESIGTWK
jgi:hypothetical protein